MRTEIKRTALNITTRCNLRCKHCLAFIPYYQNPAHLPYEQAKKILDVYFKVVDSVERFTVTGGEPLLNPDVYKILQAVYAYGGQVAGSVDFVTNGTILIPHNMLDLFERHRVKTRIVLSNYGPELSRKVNLIEEELKDRGIAYRISKFYGADLYYDGWIDFTDHTLKWDTETAKEDNARKCIHSAGKYFVINDGELHRCSRSFWRMKQGIIPKKLGEYVPLLDDSYTLEDKRKILLEMWDRNSSTSCAHCVGLTNSAPRVLPAQQLDS